MAVETRPVATDSYLTDGKRLMLVVGAAKNEAGWLVVDAAEDTDVHQEPVRLTKAEVLKAWSVVDLSA